MPASFRARLPLSAQRRLIDRGERGILDLSPHGSAAVKRDLDHLLRADLVERRGETVYLSAAGRAYLARIQAQRSSVDLDPFLAQHLPIATDKARRADGASTVRMDQAESPLVWLARRKGRDQKPLIAAEQLLAGERLRADFTRAHLTPRMTANWDVAAPQSKRRANDSATMLADTAVAARQRVQHALKAAGPEFAGLLLDVCCFLKGLDDVERERRWPPRSAKIVLQLGLDRLARHYGLGSEARGCAKAEMRTWLAPDAAFVIEEF